MEKKTRKNLSWKSEAESKSKNKDDWRSVICDLYSKGDEAIISDKLMKVKICLYNSCESAE